MDQADKQTKLDGQRQTVQLEAFFQAHLDLLGVFDTSARVVRLNPAWEKALGYPVSDLVGVCILDFVHPDDSDAAVGAIAKLLDPAEVVSFVGRFRDQG